MENPPEKRTVPEKFAMCRVFMHAWEYVDVQKDGRELIQSLRCLRCGTEKFVRINGRTGEAKGYTYDYPDDYLITGGAMLPEERSAIRLAQVKTNMKGQR